MHDINAQKVSASLVGKVMHLRASLPREEWNDDFDRKLERVVELVAKSIAASATRCSASISIAA